MKDNYANFAARALSVTIPSLVFCSNQCLAASVTASASGAWTAGATWSDASPATAGNDYSIDGFTATSPTDTNTVTFPGDSITVAKTGTNAGILNLSRVHNVTEQIITTTLPPITLSNGAIMRFQSSGGSNRWNVGGAASLAVSGTVLLDNAGGNYSANINLAGPVSGSGVIQYKTANSSLNTTERTLSLNAASSSYSGNWFIQHVNSGDDFGTLAAGAANALGTGTVTLDTRARLRNNANNGFDSLTGITIGQSTAAVFFNGRDWTSPTAALTVSAGGANVGTAHLNIGSVSQAGGSINLTVGGSKDGKLITSGNADFTGGVINVGFGGSPIGKTFDLVTYGGDLVTAPIVDAGDTGRLVPVVDNGTGTDSKVTFSLSGSVANLVWLGNEVGFENDWDNNIALNFDNGGATSTFRQYDNVTFGNTSGSNTPNIIGTLTPLSVTFDHSTNDYTLGGAGILSGITGISKAGSGTLTIASTTASNFSGGLNISGGTVNISTAQNYTGNIAVSGTGSKLVLGNAAALGATGSRTISVTNGGQLDFNGSAPGTSRTHTYRISGDGGGTGALVNNAGSSLGSNAGIQNLELLGNATIGGSVRYDIARVDTTSGAITGNGHTLTKTGANQIMLRGAASNLSIIVNQGILGVEDNDSAFGGSGGNVKVNDTAVLGVWGARTIATPVTLNNGSTLRALGGGAANWTGAITLSGASTVDLSGQAKTLSGSIGGSGSFSKTGANTLTLSGNSNYSGGTTITLGLVNVTSSTAFGTGAVTFQHSASSTTTTRADLVDVTLTNDFNLNTNARTGFRGPINTGVGNTLSTLSGIVNVQANVGNGGHFSSADGGVLRLTGTINSTGPIPNIRSGVVEMGTSGGNLTALAHGEGTLRLVANNGIQPSLDLRLALSAASILDLNGFNQSLAQVKRNVPDHTTGTSYSATITNSAGTPSVFTIDGSTNHAFSGTINNGTGGVSFVKKGSSIFTLNGAHTYAGDTTVEGGTLSLNNAYLADASAVRITTGATLNLTHAAADTVDKLFVDGIQQPAGTYDSGNTTYITGSGSLNVATGPSADPFLTWADAEGLDGSPGKEDGFNDDPDGDGVENGLEWILGGGPLDGTSGALLASEATALDGLTLSFDRNEDAIGEATLIVEYNSTLGSPWASAAIGATSTGPDANGVTVDIDTDSTPDRVTVNIPASNSGGGKLFGRLKASEP